MWFGRKKTQFGKYPSCDMLNNALRFIRDGKTEDAMLEIISAIEKAGGYFHKDVQKTVEETKEQWWAKRSNYNS